MSYCFKIDILAERCVIFYRKTAKIALVPRPPSPIESSRLRHCTKPFLPQPSGTTSASEVGRVGFISRADQISL